MFWNEEDLDDEDDDGGFVSSFTDDDDEDYDDEDDEWFFVPDGANVRTQSEDLFNIDDEDGHGGYVMDYVKMANTRGGGGDANDDVDARCVDVAREPAMYRACVVTDVRIVGGREVTREGVERRAFWRMIYMIIHSWIRVRA